MNQESCTSIKSNKKIAVTLSIVFSIIVLIGGTFAFFNGSSTNKVDFLSADIDINDALEYSDDTSKMRGELIPVDYNDLSVAYQNDCIDDEGLFACSIYEFSIKNKANVAQELMISLNPAGNTFTNLHYRTYEIIGNTPKVINASSSLERNNLSTLYLFKNVKIKPDETKKYQILFYVENKDYDQTAEDTNKKFGASIKVSSVATGKYIIKNFGETCWETELIEDTQNEYRLTRFNGIDNNPESLTYGAIDEMCTGYVSYDEDDDSYSITIPHVVTGKSITALGDSLFSAVTDYKMEELWIPTSFNKYQRIKNIEIEEGIKTIGKDPSKLSNEEIEEELGEITESLSGTFMGVGFSDEGSLFDGGVSIKIPTTLNYIGPFSFYSFGAKNLDLKNINLTYIGPVSFANSTLNSLILPSTLDKIELMAFGLNKNLTQVEFVGADTGTSNLTEISNSAFYSCNLSYSIEKPLKIPQSVEYIGTMAFAYNYNLTQVEFVGADTGTNNLTEIWDSAFINCGLTYLDSTKPLIIPASAYRGVSVFSNNPNLLYIEYR